MADSAIALAIIANKASPNKMMKLNFDLVLFVASVKENKIIAITPISTALNTNKKLRSLYISFPVYIKADRNTNKVTKTIGVKILAIVGEILFTSSGLF